MADTIERLYRLTVDATNAVNQLKKATSAADEMGKKFGEVGEAVKKFAALVGITLSVGFVVDTLRKSIDAMDDTVKAAQRVGVAAEELQKLRYAAANSGSSIEEMDAGLEHLSRSMQDVGLQTTQAGRDLAAFGVKSTDTTQVALAKLADGFAKLPDGAQKTAIAMDVFGKSVGARLIPLLNQGSKGFATLGDEASKFGLVISEQVLKQAEAFNDQLSRLHSINEGATAQFTAGLLPALTALVDAYMELTKAGTGFQSAGATIGSWIVTTAKDAALLGERVTEVAKGFALMAAILAHPSMTMNLMSAAADDIKDSRKSVDDFVKALEDGFAKANAAQTALAEATENSGKRIAIATESVAERAAKAAQLRAEATKAATAGIEAQTKAEKEWQDTVANDKDNEALRRTISVLHDYDDTLAEEQKAAEDAFAANQHLQTQMNVWTDMLETGTQAQKDYAAAQILANDAAGKTAPALEKQSEAVQAVNKDFDSFLDNLASGSESASQAFSDMVRSIIADLLKLAAKTYIIDALFPGGAPKKSASGNIFESGQLQAFATGGVVNGPTYFGMAGRRLGLMGEAGPEGILPLQRMASGALGVNAAGAGATALQVSIHNYADASVSAKRDDAGNLQVIVEQTKKSLAADVRRGGNDFSRAAEAAWRLSRGSAAPF